MGLQEAPARWRWTKIFMAKQRVHGNEEGPEKTRDRQSTLQVVSSGWGLGTVYGEGQG